MKYKAWKAVKCYFEWILALPGTYGICYLGGLAGISHASFSAVSVPVFVTLSGLLMWTRRNLSAMADEKQRGRRVRYAGILSYFFSAAMILGYQLQTYGLTDGGVRGKCGILIRAACLSIAAFPFANLLFWGIGKADSAAGGSGGLPGWKPGAVFGVSMSVIFLCLIPVWLAYYPIIMSYDFHRQVNEAAKGFAYFWPLQPLAHTWIIWLFLRLGYLLGNLEAGMACMALFHMLVYSLVSAYACTFLYRVTGRSWVVPAGIVFFGIFPLNSVLVVCTTKDVLFGSLFLLFLLLLAERFFMQRPVQGENHSGSTGKGWNQYLWDFLIFLEGCVMAQFRNNCLYALAAFGLVWFVCAARKEKWRVLLLCVLLAAGSRGAGAAVKAALGTQLGAAKVEMYSVPIMQFTRVGYYHENELDAEEWELLNAYVPAELWKGYYPPLSDAVKSIVAVTTFDGKWDGHMVQLLRDWFRLARKYPNEYIDAFLELTRGYWFWDDRSGVECLGYGIEGRMGTIYTYNSSAMEDGTEIVHKSKFPWLERQLEKIVSDNSYYNWPVVSVLFKTAFYPWGLVLTFLAFLYLRRKKQAVLCLFPAFYMGTLLLGPVVQMRYIFPIMLALPVLTSLLWLPAEARENAGD